MFMNVGYRDANKSISAWIKLSVDGAIPRNKQLSNF